MFSLVLFSCNSTGGVFRAEFRRIAAVNDPIEIKCDSMHCDIIGAVDGFAADSLYVFYTMRHPKHRMVICDRTTMEPIAAVAHVGNGANEYGFVNLNSRIARESDGIKIWLLAADKELAAKINLTACCREKRTVVDTTIMLREHKRSHEGGIEGNIVVFDVLDDSLALCESVCADGVQRRIIYDYKNRKTLYDYSGLYVPIRRPLLNGGVTAIDGNLRIVVTAMPLFNQINVCDFDGSNAFVVSDAKSPQSPKELESLDDMVLMDRMFNSGLLPSGVVVTDSRIVAHYLDRAHDTSELRVLDWAGKPLYTLRSDKGFQNISVSDDGMLYGFVSDSEIRRADISRYLQ